MIRFTSQLFGTEMCWKTLIKSLSVQPQVECLYLTSLCQVYSATLFTVPKSKVRQTFWPMELRERKKMFINPDLGVTINVSVCICVFV